MDNPMLKRLEQFTLFSDEDRKLLDNLISDRQSDYDAKADIIREGEHSPDIHIVVTGLAYRYKMLEDGSRQIMAFLARAIHATRKSSS